MDEVRPLVLMTPKSLLRNKSLADSNESFTDGRFHRIVGDPKTLGNEDEVEKLVFCTGKMAIDLHESIDDTVDTKKIHIVRFEELYPYPHKTVNTILNKYKNVTSAVWVQEEPKNMGAWNYIDPYLRESLPDHVTLDYVGRRRRSSPSEGDPNFHKHEQQRIINTALGRNEGRTK